MRLSEEAMLAFELETRLMANPRITERRNAYYAHLKADREMLLGLDSAILVAAIRAMKLWTIDGWEDRKTKADMAEAISRCMQGKDRDRWLAALAPEPSP